MIHHAYVIIITNTLIFSRSVIFSLSFTLQRLLTASLSLKIKEQDETKLLFLAKRHSRGLNGRSVFWLLWKNKSFRKHVNRLCFWNNCDYFLESECNLHKPYRWGKMMSMHLTKWTDLEWRDRVSQCTPTEVMHSFWLQTLKGISEWMLENIAVRLD